MSILSGKINGKEPYYRYDKTTNHVLNEENTSGTIIKACTSNGHPLTMIYRGETYYLTTCRGAVLALTNTSGAIVDELNPYRYAGYRYVVKNLDIDGYFYKKLNNLTHITVK